MEHTVDRSALGRLHYPTSYRGLIVGAFPVASICRCEQRFGGTLYALLRWEGVIRTIAVLDGLHLADYLWWRLTATWNVESLEFSLLLVAAEVHGLLNSVLFAFMTVGRQAPAGVSAPAWAACRDLRADVQRGSGYSRSDAHRQQRGHLSPHDLRAGRRLRAEDKALALRMGCRHLSRPDNRHAKAGNLNAALPRTEVTSSTSSTPT